MRFARGCERDRRQRPRQAGEGQPRLLLRHTPRRTTELPITAAECSGTNGLMRDLPLACGFSFTATGVQTITAFLRKAGARRSAAINQN